MDIRLSGQDFVIIGIVVAAFAGFIFVFTIAFPTFTDSFILYPSDDDLMPFLNGIETRYRELAVWAWLVVASGLSLIGILRLFRDDQSKPRINKLFHFVLLFFIAKVFLAYTIDITDRISRAEYVPIVTAMKRDLYVRDHYYVFHNYLSPQEARKGRILSKSELQERHLKAIRNLDHIGMLLHEPRHDSEDYKSYVQRLSSYFPGAIFFTGKVVGVIHGDIISVMHDGKAELIRLSGIDCPEAGQAYGEEAKQYTRGLIYDKNIIVIVRDHDTYERTLGDVKLMDGRILNQELVKAGLAWWFQKYAPDDTMLEDLEKDARTAKIGLWADQKPVPPWRWRETEWELMGAHST